MDQNWLHSSRAMSGLFGLSINLKDNPNTATPFYSHNMNHSANLRYASIPNEIVCTENLTPWIKLLPCGKSKGLAKLFRSPHKLLESQYFSIGLVFRKLCQDGPECSQKTFELKQTLSVVYNTDLFSKQSLNEQSVWTFATVFAQQLDSVCPVAEISNIYMDLGNNGVFFFV